MKSKEAALPIQAGTNEQSQREPDTRDSFTERWRTRIRQAASKVLCDPFYSKAEAVKRGSALGSGKK